MQGFADMVMRSQHLKHRFPFFASSKTAAAMRIKFARPDPQLPPAVKPPAKGKAAKTK